MCRLGSLIGFALIAQRSGPNRQSQASKSSAKPQKTQQVAAKQMARDKLPFSLHVFVYSNYQYQGSVQKRKKEMGRLS